MSYPEAPDHTGIAPKHSEAAKIAQAKNAFNLPMQNFEAYLASNIQKAIAEDPQRLSHGHTKYNAFWIDTGKIVPYNEYKKVLKSQNVISVHSHSAEGWKTRNEITEPFEPLNGADLEGLQHMVKYGYGNTLALISAYGQLEYIRFTKDSDRRFLALTRKQLYKAHELPLEHRTTEMYRKLMQSFCEHYRLEYKTGLRWK